MNIRKIVYFLLTFLIFTSCKIISTDENKNGENNLIAECFRERLTITLTWKNNTKADEYILMRARDEISGFWQFEEIYRGRQTRYVDKNAEDSIRYIYRLDYTQKGKIITGEYTEIGVGSSAEIDTNEPNDQKERATALSVIRRGTMHHFRFSDNRELTDTDWYKVTVKSASVLFIKIDEDGAGEVTTLRMKIGEQEETPAEQGKWYEIKNETKNSKDFLIEIKPDKPSFAETGFTGGMIRSYSIVSSDVKEDPKDILNPDKPVNPILPGDENNGNPGDSVIEERRELFKEDNSGWFLFLLSETKYTGQSYTFWKYLDKEWDETTGITMELVKESGNLFGGYGFFFSGGNIEGYGECMLAVLIRTGGSFAVGKVINGKYEELVKWTDSVYLRKGYGVRNVVNVRKDKIINDYVVTINGVEQQRFFDIEQPVCNGLKTGIAAVITAIEQFPQTPVKVGYK